MMCCDIFDIFEESKNIIKEYQHWKLLIRNRNTTLGNCVAITKRHMDHFSEITPEEMADFVKVVQDVEKAIKKSFQCDKFNYLMLMMKDKHTHFHILPRYSSSRIFAGIEWLDEDWPKSTHQQKDPVPQLILEKIRREIKKNI